MMENKKLHVLRVFHRKTGMSVYKIEMEQIIKKKKNRI